ncbi:MAG: hypothetical protein EOP04_26755 [Proteobacteria bacterium]|nr:MAG: hypothetical protein EOP04_26755 [Pseudomonadota bacterium]
MRLILLSAFIVVLASCGDNANDSTERKDGFSQSATTPEDSLFEEVMHAHDSAMPKMGPLKGMSAKFDAKVDSLKNAKSNPALQKEYAVLSTELKQASDHMNEWMENFVHDSAQNDPQKRIEYLSSEKEKVTKVKDEIFSVLAKADSALKK